jgi:2-aminoadipate transaminase
MAALEDLWSERVRSGPAFGHGPGIQPTVPIRYNFGQGVPAPEAYPIADLQRYAAEVLEQGADVLDYASTGSTDELVLGYTGLRQQLASWIKLRQGREVAVGDIMVGAGSIQCLSLIASAFVGPGDGVIVEASTFPYPVQFLRATGATVSTVPLDENGMETDVLEERLLELRQAGVRPKLVYTIATFQVPTATVLPVERRRRLIELAEEWDLVIVEDNCYYETRLEGEDVPTIFSLDHTGRVILTDSFSKILAPALRTGWVAAHPTLMQAIVRMRQDLGPSQWIARVLEAYMGDGRLQPQIDAVRAINRRKRDVTDAALQRHCAPWIRYQKPMGGLYFWLELAEELDWEKVAIDAAKRGIACRGGETYLGDESGRRFLRIAYLHESEEQIEWGIRTLGEVLATCARSPQRS